MKSITIRKVKRMGKIDGRGYKWIFYPFVRDQFGSKPAIDQTDPAQIEKEIFKRGEHDILIISDIWKENDKKLKPLYCKALTDKNNAAAVYDKEFKESEMSKLPFEKAMNELQAIESPGMAGNLMVFFLILIGLFEFPLNGLVFQIFGASLIETFIMAGSICITLPLSAHFFGKAIRQDHKNLVDKVFIVVSPLIIFSLIGAISVLREKFFEAGQNILNINLSPETATTMFIIINLAIFFVAVIISYEGSRKNHKDFRTKRRVYKMALTSLKKESKEAVIAGKKLNIAERKLNHVREFRKKQFEKYCNRAELVIKAAEVYMEVYRNMNIYNRKDSKVPLCFKNPVEKIIMPDNLIPRNLDWNCTGYSENILEKLKN